MSTRYENSATATNAGARMTLINTIFQVKSNKIGTYGTLKKKKKKKMNQQNNKIAKKLDVFGDAKFATNFHRDAPKMHPSFS
jgi:hypothetical protein